MKDKKVEMPQDIEQAIEWINPDYKIAIAKKRGAYICINSLYSKKIKDKRYECHKWFDKLWSNGKQRHDLYIRLANELNLDIDSCHFATMNEEQLNKALSLLKIWWKEKYDR